MSTWGRTVEEEKERDKRIDGYKEMFRKDVYRKRKENAERISGQRRTALYRTAARIQLAHRKAGYDRATSKFIATRIREGWSNRLSAMRGGQKYDWQKKIDQQRLDRIKRAKALSERARRIHRAKMQGAFARRRWAYKQDRKTTRKSEKEKDRWWRNPRGKSSIYSRH